MSVRKQARIAAMDKCIDIAEQARLDRPDKPKGSHRRRCGDVIRWKMNNDTIDQIKTDILAAMRSELGLKPVGRRGSREAARSLPHLLK